MQLQIQRERLSKGWTSEEAAEKMGCDPSTLRTIETGRRYPYPLFRLRAAKLYEKDAGEIFADVDEAYDYLRKLGGAHVTRRKWTFMEWMKGRP